MITLPQNITCGYCDCSEFGELTVSPPRKVTKYEIEFYLEDALTTTTDDRTYKIKKDHIQIAKPGQIRHSVLPFKTVYLKFESQGEIAETLDGMPEYFLSSHPQTIRSLIEEIALLRESENTILLYSKILSVLSLLCSDSKIPTQQSGNTYKIISEAKRFIEQNASEPIKLEDIAAHVHLSPIHFHNIFSKATGASPHRYLLQCRIEKAKKLLWDTEIPICQVAERTGFGCQQYLSKVFKKETGFTPASYRKACQENYTL